MYDDAVLLFHEIVTEGTVAVFRAENILIRENDQTADVGDTWAEERRTSM